MDQQEATSTIANLLSSARMSIEAALTMGREHNVPVDIGALGISDDMWYVGEFEIREELRDRHCLDPQNPTAEELEEVEREFEEIKANGGYDSYGYKQMGWMSSSTNC